MIISESVELYHGSYTIVEKPDLEKCKDGKDFGRGFYVTTDHDQAERFVKTAVEKAAKNGIVVDYSKGYVSKYSYKDIGELRKHIFETADIEWLHCIAAHRKKGILTEELDKWVNFDIIGGKIADDNTNMVITTYINGLYGEIGLEETDKTAIRLLKPNKLTDQICFRTETSLSSLEYLGFDLVTI